MEYVDGVDFRAFEGRPFPELLPLMVQAVQGLAYLRSRNVVHGDLSSNNFLVTIENRTRVTKILDLGFAGIFRPEGADGVSGAGAGQFVGKFAFASPEHFFPSDIDWRSDVYSLGVIFHRLLTGEAPITVSRESRYFDWMVAHEKEHTFEVPSPVEGPPLPEALRDVLRRMLARSRDARPRSYEEILEVLEGVRRNLSPALEPDLRSLETLPPPVEGRMGSSGSGRTSSSPAVPSPAVRSYPEAAAPEPPDSVETSQQKRWPDLEVPESHTERFVSFSASPSHGIPVVPSPRFEEQPPRFEEPERRFEEPERRFEEPPERRFEEPARFEEPRRLRDRDRPVLDGAALVAGPGGADEDGAHGRVREAGERLGLFPVDRGHGEGLAARAGPRLARSLRGEDRTSRRRHREAQTAVFPGAPPSLGDGAAESGARP